MIQKPLKNSPSLEMHQEKRDHGGGLDEAVSRFGGRREDWLDLSTGINPHPYPIGKTEFRDWADLPDRSAHQALVRAARDFWGVPNDAVVLPAPGASSLIARIPALAPKGRVQIKSPTYNEHAAAFSAAGWNISEDGPVDARVLVHPNNPDGTLWDVRDIDAHLNIIDESFCDVAPEASLVKQAVQPGCLVLKSFGKFWGLAGLRLGFAIGRAELIEQLATMLGPWPVSGPALRIGATALQDIEWAARERTHLRQASSRLDQILESNGAELAGGTSLFRLYKVDSAQLWQDRLARNHIWTRIFPYSNSLLRLGLPPNHGWNRLSEAL